MNGHQQQKVILCSLGFVGSCFLLVYGLSAHELMTNHVFRLCQHHFTMMLQMFGTKIKADVEFVWNIYIWTCSLFSIHTTNLYRYYSENWNIVLQTLFHSGSSTKKMKPIHFMDFLHPPKNAEHENTITSCFCKLKVSHTKSWKYIHSHTICLYNM